MYAALVLDAKSKQALLAYAPADFEVTYAHHVTLQYPCSEVAFESIKLNVQPCAEVTGVRTDADLGAQAVQVCMFDTDGNNLTQQSNATKLHVTISCKEGTKPVVSKFLFIDPMDADPIRLMLTGTIELVGAPKHWGATYSTEDHNFGEITSIFEVPADWDGFRHHGYCRPNNEQFEEFFA